MAIIHGKPGDATIQGTPQGDTIHGTPEADVIYGHAGGDTIHAGDGDDTIYGGEGGDTLWGNGGNDTMYGGPGADTMHGGEGHDTMYGGEGNDTMHGNAGDDTMYTGNGINILHGGYGNDHLIADGDGTTNTLNGNAGDDTITIIADNIPDGSTIYANGGTGNNTIVVQGEGYTVTDSNEGGTGGTMTVTDGTKTFKVNYTGVNTKEEVICFAEGTMIGTPEGEVAVERLQIGDSVLTAEGKTVPVRWVGRQTLVKSRLEWRMQPVKMDAGALGDGLPHSDLTVTASHGMVLDGLVINASALVNGDSIRFVPLAELPEQYRVFHVETDDHDVILANGSPSETFIDYVDRQAFDNYAEYVALYGIETRVVEMPRHRISSRRLLPLALRERLGIEGMMSAAKTA